ncbi:hypothetical protein SAMN05444004_11130 [Jannaschia faecimaris]|uniref:Uncharacterized protein n=1 Tax=Jannaschia faecimaris TaxID=1244108 RepID=A0A1H3SA35_9RHOB|nr:hydrolase [Jannaschia faecimaris]SDZ34530.1 hypothetical protein SAMN05444004_11130 [Jannaschia faecimaris]
MEIAAEAVGSTAKLIFMFYTTCSPCKRAHGRNYVVGIAEV